VSAGPVGGARRSRGVGLWLLAWFLASLRSGPVTPALGRRVSGPWGAVWLPVVVGLFSVYAGEPAGGCGRPGLPSPERVLSFDLRSGESTRLT
jgi:hypothetical protein